MAERRIPDFLVEQIALGEASERTRDVVTRTLGEAEVQRRVEAIRRSNEEILGLHPATSMAQAIRARAETAPAASTPGPRILSFPAVTRRLAVPLAVAAVALFAVVLVPRIADQVGRPAWDGIKGKPTLLIYRDGGQDAVLLENGARAREGDHIQIKYMSAGRPFGVIVSIDGRGSVTLHYPAAAGEPTALDPGGEALDYAYVLDDAPGYERFFLVTSENEFSATLALSAAEKLARGNARRGDLDLPAGFEQMSTLLTKGEN